VVQSQPRANSSQDPILKNTIKKGGRGSSSRALASQKKKKKKKKIVATLLQNQVLKQVLSHHLTMPSN
jgi:hypothetical protein